ncbi:LANO_0E03554g1_1 [Lachancea nothofagi CBS 11611]|uniref:LANO_0E03554g1_1 n=1 Tax=Lachancea nothofagi CBS 11611 TaxID=1266666 RepID=A0A1G4JR73_9SACH|nr:LANO_0E03554g1_1 [Lachancea nothofagi CBS 11611]
MTHFKNYLAKRLVAANASLSRHTNFFRLLKVLLTVYLATSTGFGTNLAVVEGHPVSSHIATIGNAFQTQDKLCSMDHIDGQGSYRNLVSTLAGIDVRTLGQSKKMYTGFKFHKTYQFGGLFKKVQPSLKMTYCNEGRIKWQTDYSFASDLNWNEPMCVYDFSAVPIVGETKKFWKTFKKPKPDSNANIKVSPKLLASQDLDNFHCFKLVRRQKYVHRNVSLYMPNKQIGGLFYCDISNGAKKDILSQMTDNLHMANLKDSTFCNSSNAIPLQPLISDSYRKHWTEIKSGSKLPFLRRVSRTNMKKVVPFMHTPLATSGIGNFSIRTNAASNQTISETPNFSVASFLRLSFNSKSANKQWFAEIDPNEEYEIDRQNLSNKDRLEDSMHQMEQFLIRANLRNRKIIEIDSGPTTKLSIYGKTSTTVNHLISKGKKAKKLFKPLGKNN